MQLYKQLSNCADWSQAAQRWIHKPHGSLPIGVWIAMLVLQMDTHLYECFLGARSRGYEGCWPLSRMQNHSYNDLLVLQQSLDRSTGVPTTYSSYYSPKPNLHSNKQRKLFSLLNTARKSSHLQVTAQTLSKMDTLPFFFFLSLPSRILRQEKYPFWSLNSHSPTVESTLSGTASTCIVLFTCRFTHLCRTKPLLVMETKSSAEGLQLE